MKNIPGFVSPSVLADVLPSSREVEPLEDFANELLNIITLVSIFSCKCHPSLLFIFKGLNFMHFILLKNEH